MIDLLLEKDENKRPKMKDILKMKSVIDKANKYNINLDILDTIEEDKNIKMKYKSENIESENKNNFININKNINCKIKEILKSSGKKEKSPENKYKKINLNLKTKAID